MYANGLRESPGHEEKKSLQLSHVTSVISICLMFRSMPAATPSRDLRPMDWWHFGQFMFLPRCHKQLIGTHGNQCDSGEGHHIGSDQKFQSRRDLESMGPHGILSGNCASGSKVSKGRKTEIMENPVAKRSTRFQSPYLDFKDITGLHLLKRRRCAENLPKASRVVGMVHDVHLMDLHQCWKIENPKMPYYSFAMKNWVSSFFV